MGGNFNDDPLWLILGVAAYIKETGDWSILDEPVPYDNQPGTEEPLYEHLQRSLRYTLDRLGPHGLPLIGRADWNDCLNLNCFSDDAGRILPDHHQQRRQGGRVGLHRRAVRAGGRGNGRRWPSGTGRRTEASQDYRDAAAEMESTVLAHGWDGAWFARAYDDFGQPVGSQECAEGQIFIEPQGMCVMAGIGVEDGQAEQALDSVAERLATPARHRPAAAGLLALLPASWARSPPTRPATRRMPASSATPTRGS